MIKCIYNQPCILGESPLWDYRENQLYWVDIEGLKIHCLNPDSGVHKEWDMPSRPGSIALDSKGGVLVALSNEIVHFDPSTNLFAPIAGTTIEKTVRFNDGKCDSKGRFWVGSMDLLEKSAIGALYCLDHKQTLHLKDQEIMISNGLGWSPDQKTMYFTDSPKRTLYVYDFNLETGEIANRKVFATVAPGEGYPDGLCVDQEGYVWSAHFMGGRVTRYAPDGSIDQIIQIPAVCPTSCCFGGKDNQQLFITTATRDLTSAQLLENPLNGGIFMLETGKIKGRKEVPFLYDE